MPDQHGEPLAPNSSYEDHSRRRPAPAGERAPNSARRNNPLLPVKTAETRNPAIVVVPVLLVLVTFLFWYQTWWGRRLSHEDMGKYLSDTSAPHKTQHALSQLSQEMARRDPA